MGKLCLLSQFHLVPFYSMRVLLRYLKGGNLHSIHLLRPGQHLEQEANALIVYTSRRKSKALMLHEAAVTQMLAHGLSHQTCSASATLQSLPNAPPLPPVLVPASMPTVMKKPSRWKLSFGKGNDEAAMSTWTDSSVCQE